LGGCAKKKIQKKTKKKKKKPKTPQDPSKRETKLMQRGGWGFPSEGVKKMTRENRTFRPTDTGTRI